MAQMFVFTAGNREARRHLRQSIEQSINEDIVLNSFDETERRDLLRVRDEGGGFYAWGATPGPENKRIWEAMAAGDYVLCVYDGTYQFASRVLYKSNNPELARRIWGESEDGRAWQYMYYLTSPEKVNRPVSELAGYLNRAYRGFTKISDDRVAAIVEAYGSIDRFLEQQSSARITRITVTKLFGMFDHDIPLNVDDRTSGRVGTGCTPSVREA